MKNKINELLKLKKLFVLLVVLIFQFGLMLPVFAMEIEGEEQVNSDMITDTTTDNDDELSNQDEEDNSNNEEVEIITKEDILNKYSDGIEFIPTEAVIYGNIKEITVTVLDIIEKIDIASLSNDYGIVEIKILDEFDNELIDTDLVNNKCKLIIFSDTSMDSYNIIFKEDYNQDNVVNEDDVNFIIDSIFDDKDNFKTEDVSSIDYIVNNGTFEMPDNVNTDPIESTIEVVGDSYVGEEIEVKLVIDTKNVSDRVVTSGEINYDENILKLNDIYVSENILLAGMAKGNYFLYLLENNDEFSYVTITFKFSILASGMTTVLMNNIQLANKGFLLKIDSNLERKLMIQEYGKGGDGDLPPVDNNDNNLVNSTPNNKNNITTTNNISTSNKKDTNNNASNITATTISLNNDTYIKELWIEGYSIDFNNLIYNYSIDIDSDINSLEFNIILNSNTSTYYIEGNDNFQVGKNEVIITVQAEDGSTSSYVIEVNKASDDKESDQLNKNETSKENKSFIKSLSYLIVPIALIILIILDIVYILSKKEK